MLENVGRVLTKIDDFVWGLPLILLIIAVGIYLTVRLRGLQIKHLPKALKFIVKTKRTATEKCQVCGFVHRFVGDYRNRKYCWCGDCNLCRRSGRAFWMVIAALFGMATKYSEGLLAIKYRVIEPDGHVLGGPFYYIEHGMGKKSGSGWQSCSRFSASAWVCWDLEHSLR